MFLPFQLSCCLRMVTSLGVAHAVSDAVFDMMDASPQHGGGGDDGEGENVAAGSDRGDQDDDLGESKALADAVAIADSPRPSGKRKHSRKSKKGSQRRRVSGQVQFDSVEERGSQRDDDAGEGKGKGKRKGKVVPVDDMLPTKREGSDGQSVMSKSSAQGYHAAVTNSRQHEETSLVMLRRVLFLVTLGVTALSLVAMTFAKGVIGDEITSARVLKMEGDRLVYQKVPDNVTMLLFQRQHDCHGVM